MNRPDLHRFEQDLKNKPGLGSTDAPRTIKAKKLDDNNKKLTLLKGEGEPPAYRVKYTAEGTIITDLTGLPKDALARQFDVCENGQPRTWYFVVWENEPTIP
jgi:hypothetical protein